ncbi:MAG TPA: hypothetical protein PLP23_03280 [Panacibacter sp.]|nr:hypothetical protein [Panacibacter sp.]
MRFWILYCRVNVLIVVMLGRYIETGDNVATAKNAEAVWRTSKALKELKIKKGK